MRKSAKVGGLVMKASYQVALCIALCKKKTTTHNCRRIDIAQGQKYVGTFRIDERAKTNCNLDFFFLS